MSDAPPKPRAWRAFFLGVLTGLILAVVLTVGGITAAGFLFRDALVQQKSERLAPPLEYGAADYDWNLVDAEGNTVPASDFRGEPWLLHYWSPSCTSCEAEVPALNRLYESIRAEPIAFTAVAVGVEPAELAEAAASLGITYPVYAIEDAVPEVFGVKAGPASFITSASGTIVYKHLGASKWDDPSAEFLLKSLAAETGG